MARSFEIFISFKNLGPDGNPTRDSRLAQEVFDFLTSRGFKVFFSNVSLESLGVAAYKKVIDESLDVARILIAVGTSGENLGSEWVRYEWDSFFNDILSGIKEDAQVFVYLEDASISSLPRTLRQCQVFFHGPDSLARLLNFISNALRRTVADPADSSKLICRIVTDWKSITPGACEELERLGWRGRLQQWGRSQDKPRVWEALTKGQDIGAVAEEILTVHRILYPTDPFAHVVFEQQTPPSYQAPPWFIPRFLGDDLEITCKQCEYSSDDFDHYSDQVPPGECPICGLGRADWLTYNFLGGRTIATCKRCGYQADIYGKTTPPKCSQCQPD